MRVLSVRTRSSAIGFLLVPMTMALLLAGELEAQASSADPVMAAGDASAFRVAFVQPVEAPAGWREIYREVERCAGQSGDYDTVRWAVIAAPLRGPEGPTFAFTVGSRIVLIRNDTTYLRHEMLHHILDVAGWRPRSLSTGERYTTADLHPAQFFGRCTGGR
jgi:hypothetical protein